MNNNTEMELKGWQTAKSEQECFYEMEYDLDRFPLPICFDPYEEQGQLYGRNQKIQRIAHRYYRRFLNSKP